jgi:hypothetical protein
LFSAASLAGAGASLGGVRSFDKSCNLVEPSEQSYRENNVYKFKAGNQQVLLVLSRFVDGSALFCVSGVSQGIFTPLRAPELQNQYVEKIERDLNPGTFKVTIRNGNGWRVPMILYRLDLSRPEMPEVVKIKEWIDG